MSRPQFELDREQEVDGAWTWRVRRLDDAGRMTEHELRLAWADYDLWMEGNADARPVDVAEAAFAYLCQEAPELAARDRVACSWARRVAPDADAVIPSLVRPGSDAAE